MIKPERVNSLDLIKEFHEFPARLYKKDKNYIRPLDKDIEEVFNPQKNKNFKTGECERFLFKNNENETVAKHWLKTGEVDFVAAYWE